MDDLLKMSWKWKDVYDTLLFAQKGIRLKVHFCLFYKERAINAHAYA